MTDRADAVVSRPKLNGAVNAENIRELYRKMTANAMQSWILARDGRGQDKGKSKPKKPVVFKNMYPMLHLWMEEHGHCIKSKNLTIQAAAARALATEVQVNNPFVTYHLIYGLLIYHVHTFISYRVATKELASNRSANG